jgi:predicted PurR-regulated permease PerM
VVTRTSIGAGWQRAVITLTGTVVSVVVVATLYWAQSVFIPVALAAFLTFLLTPFVAWFRQRGLGGTPAVIVVVFSAAVVLGGIGWLVTVQITTLLRELPRYTQNVKEKVRSFKEAAEKSGPLKKMVADINQELDGTPGHRTGAERTEGMEDDGTWSLTARPTTVIVEPQSPAWLSRLTSFLSPLLQSLGELALAVILVVFMLLKRGELRNRIIRLAGPGKIVATTKFVDEAGQRVSRFLLTQALVNGTFGLVLALGLLLIGVKYALLWGFLGAMLRYLPYIGPYLAAVFPVSLSLAISQGWGTTLMVLGLFLALELTVANFIEPRLYGQSTGVSEIALLVSAAFWAFLWGPIGLVLSSPLTVCLVVLGRYFPQLEFLAVLLGDEPALDSRISLYQRLLARDQDEAENLVLEQIQKGESPDQVFDTMLLPALSAIKRNRLGGDITEEEETYAVRAIREIVEELGEQRLTHAPDPSDGNGSPPAAEQSIPIFGCPAHDHEDRLALEMLQHLLDPARWCMELIAPETLATELLQMVEEKHPAVVCIAATLPGGLAHTRYLCKRLRTRFPDLPILVGRWGLVDNRQNPEPSSPTSHNPAASALVAAGTDSAERPLKESRITQVVASLEEAGADLVASTLRETRQQLLSLLPVLVQSRDARGCNRDPGDRGATRHRSSNREPPNPSARAREVTTAAPTP